MYTAGVVLPTPLACCRYYHRSLNPKKLIEVRVCDVLFPKSLRRPEDRTLSPLTPHPLVRGLLLRRCSPRQQPLSRLGVWGGRCWNQSARGRSPIFDTGWYIRATYRT